MKMKAFETLLNCLSGLILLAAGWLVGQKLTYAWSVRQKRRELQLSNLQQFYTAYGEFFIVWKLWNRLEPSAIYFEDRKWELLKRAATAEATIEALLVKISSESCLTDEQLQSLGCFRVAFQQLRRAIRNRVPLDWHKPELLQYSAFKSLAVQVAQLLDEDWSPNHVKLSVASSQLLKITSNEWEGLWKND